MAIIENAAPAVGKPAPWFSLPDTDGRLHELSSEPASIVVFTCNHCPYALGWHQRIVDVAHDFAGRGVQTLAINSNDATRYPGDSLAAMRTRVEAGDFEGVPYLRDESQDVAHEYDAQTTPDVFLIDANGLIRYRGAPDSDVDDPALNASWLRAALSAVLDGRDPDPAETPPVGCTIKWRA